MVLIFSIAVMIAITIIIILCVKATGYTVLSSYDLMAASVSGGYQYKLVNKSLVSEYTCPVCALVLCNPQQTKCGHLICMSCLQQLKKRNLACPVCRTKLTDNFFSDNHINRKIKSLQVYCSNKDDGCQWKGELKDIEDHLQECPYHLMTCSSDCGMDLQRRHLQNHLENDCPKRLINCQYCNEEGCRQDITGDHLDVCPDYPTRCANEGCDQLIPRQQMSSHKKSCPKEMISCDYRSFGCKEKIKREEQEEHNEQWRERHLQLAVGEIKHLTATIEFFADKLQLAEKKTILNNRLMKFANFAINKSGNTRLSSCGFYTSPRGYKMCLRVDANGDGDGRDTHVSCYAHLMSGEYDDILRWPFHGEVTIELLNQLQDKNHHKKIAYFIRSTPLQCRSRVNERECAENGWGYHKFISHSQLHFSQFLNCQYLKDDTLYFRVSVKVTSNTKPWLVA